MIKKILNSILILIIIVILLNNISTISGKNNTLFNLHEKTINSELSINDFDIQYTYNITSKLSNIIFDVYNESNGEIAKGRAFGTKGEHKAAEILYENMSKLGLYTIKQQLKEITGFNKDIISKLEVLDYKVTINNEEVDCFIAPSWKGLHNNSNQINCTFDYKNLTIIKIPRFPNIFNKSIAEIKNDFVFIDNDQWNDPNGVMPILDLLKTISNPLKFYIQFHLISLYQINTETTSWYSMYPNCKGLILYDFNDDCHDMIYFPEHFGNSLPVIFINGSTGKKIVANNDGYLLDFNLKQRYNTSVISYNVIGQLNGTDPSKTIIISCLYDSWWGQGTADSAIGMGIVMSIAKYFTDNKIIPKHTIKFIGFSGEEYDLRGAKYYEATTKEEDIIYFIDLNQLGFTQDEPRLTLDVISNKISFLNLVGDFFEDGNYVQRTGDTADLKKILWTVGGIPSDVLPFSVYRPDCNCVCILKDGGWILHHRDGLNHNEGDVLKYFDWIDTMVTGEIILDLIKHLSIEED